MNGCGNLMDAFLLGMLAGGGGGGGGGAGVFVVNISYSSPSFSADKSFAEIDAAIEAGKFVVARHSDKVFPLERIDSSKAYFVRAEYENSNDRVYVEQFVLTHQNNADSWTVENAELGKKLAVVQVSGATPTIVPEDNTRYVCGELTSLTVSSCPASGFWTIEFESGSTATTTSFPNTMKGLDSFAAEANKVYEINVLDGKALNASW